MLFWLIVRAELNIDAGFPSLSVTILFDLCYGHKWGGGFAPDSHGWLGRYISNGQFLPKGEGVGVRGGRRAFL